MSQPKGLRRKNLQCPFTWKVPVIPKSDLCQEDDSLHFSADVWSSIVYKIYLAFQYTMRGDLKRSKILLVECYIPLLDVGVFNIYCDFIKKYRIALKHIIDSAWAFLCCKTVLVKELEPLLQKIIPFDSMDNDQQSAIWAVRARTLGSYEESISAIEVALSLNPDEGLWHYYKSVILFDKRKDAKVASGEELKSFKIAYELQQLPQTTLGYASALIHQYRKPMDLKKGFQLLRKALDKWPENAFINIESGFLFLKDPMIQGNLVEAEKCFRNAVNLTGNCIAAHIALGTYLVHFKDKAEGKMHLNFAQNLRENMLEEADLRTKHVFEN